MSKEKSLKTNDGIKWDTPETPAVDSNELNILFSFPLYFSLEYPN